MDQRSTILMLRLIACAVIAAAMGAFVGQLHSMPELTGFGVLMPIAIFAFGAGVGTILFGIAAVLRQRQRPAEGVAADLAQPQLLDLAMKMEDLGASIDRLARLRDAAPLSAAHPPSAGSADGDTPAILTALEALFTELRDLSALPDAERQRRWQKLEEQRKQTAMQSASAFARSGQWSGAERAIAEIETEWPGDPAVSAIRKELESARVNAEAEAVHLAESQIESEMSLSHWEQAAMLARRLASDFPASARASAIRNRVEREKGIYTEATVGRLYDEIRHDVERRIWRRALQHAQKLLGQFPEHPRSELIRKQVHTIQENAEIEERQEQEMRIGELIRARRFAEAVGLSQELLHRFPKSPQAEAIQKLLPRIRELAAESEKRSTKASPV